MRLVPVTCASVEALESKCNGETLPAAESHSLGGCVSRHPAASMLRHGSMGLGFMPLRVTLRVALLVALLVVRP